MADGDGAHDDPIRPEGTVRDEALVTVLEESRELGLLGPGPVAPHIDHARTFLGALGDARSLVDLGSGGGLPGLVLARARPELHLVLVDAMARRCRFLERATSELGLEGRVDVECGRAEELARREDLRGRFPVVVTRSFGPPAVTAECAVGFLAPNGVLLVSEPPNPPADRWPSAGLATMGLDRGEVIDGEVGAVQILRLVHPVQDRFPRRVGIPAKRPFF